MAANLHVLVYGALSAGICEYYRFGMYQEALLAHGVELRGYTDIGYRSGAGREFLEAADDADFELDGSDLEWADVLVFRRFYQTTWNCRLCVSHHGDRPALERHRRETGHEIRPPDPLVRPLLRALETNPRLLSGRAIVYESDDNLLAVQVTNGVSRRAAHERDLVERLLRRADLVTTTTPVLARVFGRYNDSVRVIRNAIDTRRYARLDAASALPGDPRLVFYGHPARFLHYQSIQVAVDAAKDRIPDLRRIWLGTNFAGVAEPHDPLIEAAMDETVPFISDVARFAPALAALQPAIGIAPLSDHAYDRGRSELHWLEYTAAGAVTVASRLVGGGPFDVIRHGVDGFLARSVRDWRDAIVRLAESPALREEIAGRAFERVLAEYDIRHRAAEWADAYRWAADHAGRGSAGHQRGGLQDETLVAANRLRVAHRARVRSEMAEGPERLAALRGSGSSCQAPQAGPPLVSILVPVVDESATWVRRAVQSAASQTYAPIEIVVAVPTEWERPDWADEPVEGMPIRWVTVPGPTIDGPGTPDEAREAALARALVAACEAAKGTWIAPLSPEGAFTDEHVAVLLEAALEHDLEFVYGQTLVVLEGGRIATLGYWPPARDAVLTLGSEVFARTLLDVVPYDLDAWRDGVAVGWAHWERLAMVGARMANLEAVLHMIAPLAA